MRIGFPDPVPTAVRLRAALGLSRVSAAFSLESWSESRTPEEFLFCFLIRSRGAERRPSPGWTREAGTPSF